MPQPPEGPKSPPVARTGFGGASADHGNSRLGPFTEPQLLRLHRFHAEMQHADKLSELTFDYGHIFCRATFLLVTPHDEGREIKIGLMELREHDGTYTYSLACMVEGLQRKDENIIRRVRDRSTIPEFVMQHLRARFVELNSKDFSEFEIGGSRDVVSMAQWRMSHRSPDSSGGH